MLLGLSLSWQCIAAEPTFSARRFQYVAEKQSLREVLTAFSASQGWNLRLNGDFEQPISARFSTPGPEVWRILTSTHQLLWYFDGSTMHVGPMSDERSEFIPLAPGQYNRALTSLRRLGVVDARCRPRYDENAQLLVLSGPPRCVELVRAVTGQMGDSRDWEIATRIFPLKHAQAADTVARIGGQDVVIEGLATVLRRLFTSVEATAGSTGSAWSGAETMDRRTWLSPGATGGESRRGTEDAAPAVVERSLTGRALGGGRSTYLPTQPELAQPRRPGSAPAQAGTRTRIEADSATNSLVIRDSPQRLAQLASVIADLDQPRLLIEIEARMVEIEQSDLRDLGVDWSASSQRGSFSVSNGVGQTPADARAPQITASLADTAANLLLTRIRALESNGRARIVMSPRVLTVDNTEALLENTDTAYIKVAGNLEANLFSVSTGVVLRIRPSVLDSGPQVRVRLMISLESGGFSSAAVGGVPVVQRSRVFALSELEEGATLLIGGITDQRDSSGNQGVPGLGKVPVFGGLFSSKSETRTTREKLFLVTPRVVRSANPQRDRAQRPAPAAAPPNAGPSAPAESSAVGRASHQSPEQPVVPGP